MSCETYRPVSTYRQLDSQGGTFFHLVSGGCGKTAVDIEIDKRCKCTKKHHCIGVHDISIQFYSQWMGDKDRTNILTKGKLHMISESYGLVTLYQSKLLKSGHQTKLNNNEQLSSNLSHPLTNDQSVSDNKTNNIDKLSEDPEDYLMCDNSSPYISRAQLVFLSHPTPSSYEAGIKDWYGMGGTWNQKNDAMMILSDTTEHFGQTIEFERIDNNEDDEDRMIEIFIQQPKATKPLYDITFYFDSPISISNNVQSILINCILHSKPFPRSIYHENFVNNISALYMFGCGFTDANKRICTTFVKSSDMINNYFDSMSSHSLMSSNDLLFARMKVEDGWLLAGTNVKPIEMKQSYDVLSDGTSDESLDEVSIKKVDVMWKSTKIGYVCVVYKIATQGNITLTMIKK
jgi:hypothetical protein